MKRFKVVGLCLVAVFAIGVSASASASATTYLWSVGGTMAFTTANISNSLIDITGGKLKGDEIEITCPSLKIEGGLLDEGSSGKATSVKFTGCKELVKESKCKLSSETITTKEGTFDAIGASEIEVTPKTGTEFVALTIENVTGKECTLDGEYHVTGDAILEVAKAGTEEPEHELTLSRTKSNLKINTNAAEIEGSGKGKLESGADWSITSA